jgi:hypothetical protein
MTIGIAYSAGTYGTYLEWCLTALTSKDEIVAPFLPNGNSHKFEGNLRLYSGYPRLFDEAYAVELIKNLNFFRFHPKHDKHHLLSDNLTTMCNVTQSLIYLYPDKSSVLLCINNAHSKISNEWWTAQFNHHYIDPTEVYQNWPIDPNLEINQVPRWIKREFLSFYLMPSWFDQVEWYHPDIWQHEKCCVITTNELLYNFEHTLEKIEKFCKIKYVNPISDLIDHHKQNLQNQKHLNEDMLCKKIVESTVEGKNFSWSPRSLVSESWVQWQLRNLGWEIRCDGLDTFPTNSVHLKELLYSV